ncbi:probable ATP-dependent RNA helicase DDX20 isoform X2 [Thalassophryne amazonica]|uniref:probable ATP-dependent RNA helicase DDX20 isoform X2 n=1 Tax=Thalassophryne amazonica TaxID=390379 RepID=UPI00147166DD|nr:probable ATP-dependent RNA helicase DDX20 isoform X2 [Thalassophryne amazonica]
MSLPVNRGRTAAAFQTVLVPLCTHSGIVNMAASVRKAAHDIDTRKRTDDVLLSEGIDFNSLLLSQPVLDGLSAAGFQKPSPIQLKAIPLGRCGLDLIVQAKSGTGKTCVFCTIALDSLVLENLATQVLVLAPTREIAVQIHSVVMAIGCAMEGLECHVFIGGRPVSQDKPHLKKCHIAVGSPGRIKQLIELGMLSTSSIRLFVLDEADKLLEEGSFQEQINWIFSSLPVSKQMLALSATYPESLAQHLTRYMREPTFVRLNPSDMGLKGLKQFYKLVQSHALPHKIFEEKVQHLLELFSKIPFNQALVFSNLHTRAQHLADVLSSKGLPSAYISGGLSQDQRLEAMSKLKQYQCRVLISTDLTSRGIDAEKVNLVINLDVPQDWETYMHRIGRAGRFGTQGLAVTYCCHGEEENKMMAIAQKCGLTLSVLPFLEPALMDEPCDWDVCTKPATLCIFPERVSKTVKNKRSKTEGERAFGSDGTKKPMKKSHSSVRPHGEDPPRPSALNPDTSVAQTRKELQDALPKIPPLSSFKSCRSEFMTFEEAERDFHSFISTGLGRSVEVIRQFRGQEDSSVSDLNGDRELVTLDDEGAHVTNGERWKGNISPPSMSSGSSSSHSEVEEVQSEEIPDQNRGGEYPESTLRQMEAEPKADPPSSDPCTPDPKTSHQPPSAPIGRAPPQPVKKGLATNDKSNKQASQRPRVQSSRNKLRKMNVDAGKHRQNGPERTAREQTKETDGDQDEEEEEGWNTDTYWRACYRAWNSYYASTAPVQPHDYQSYYSVVHNWMAAYRMNAVYVEELMKH